MDHQRSIHSQLPSRSTICTWCDAKCRTGCPYDPWRPPRSMYDRDAMIFADILTYTPKWLFGNIWRERSYKQLCMGVDVLNIYVCYRVNYYHAITLFRANWMIYSRSDEYVFCHCFRLVGVTIVAWYSDILYHTVLSSAYLQLISRV